jgi:hypothetical protein
MVKNKYEGMKELKFSLKNEMIKTCFSANLSLHKSCMKSSERVPKSPRQEDEVEPNGAQNLNQI